MGDGIFISLDLIQKVLWAGIAGGIMWMATFGFAQLVALLIETPTTRLSPWAHALPFLLSLAFGFSVAFEINWIKNILTPILVVIYFVLFWANKELQKRERGLMDALKKHQKWAQRAQDTARTYLALKGPTPGNKAEEEAAKALINAFNEESE